MEKSNPLLLSTKQNIIPKCLPRDTAILANHGAEIFVLDSNNLFKNGNIVKNLDLFSESVAAESHVV